jgi:hypothetical protein
MDETDKGAELEAEAELRAEQAAEADAEEQSGADQTADQASAAEGPPFDLEGLPEDVGPLLQAIAVVRRAGGNRKLTFDEEFGSSISAELVAGLVTLAWDLARLLGRVSDNDPDTVLEAVTADVRAYQRDSRPGGGK